MFNILVFDVFSRFSKWFVKLCLWI